MALPGPILRTTTCATAPVTPEAPIATSSRGTCSSRPHSQMPFLGLSGSIWPASGLEAATSNTCSSRPHSPRPLMAARGLARTILRTTMCATAPVMPEAPTATSSRTPSGPNRIRRNKLAWTSSTHRLLGTGHTIIFVNSKRAADELDDFLFNKEVPRTPLSLHSFPAHGIFLAGFLGTTSGAAWSRSHRSPRPRGPLAIQCSCT
ncbi:hypothetical protein B0T09DRAFT_317718 [Sordaria sp. MPI-SDFR-AT-0083]|nr:hypothetical protein B0T09DRAFT_317718 [Sordaria sp. MPI-SDFR-AT-0083]